MARIIMCGSFKGGVGKTASSWNLAYSLAEMGKRVLAVDFDSQANLTTCFGIEDPAADEVIIAVNPQLLAMMGLQDFIRTVKKVRSRLNDRLQISGILLIMCDARTNLCKVITEQLTETFDGQIRIFKSITPNTVKVGESIYYSEPLLEYAPENKACKAYRNLAEEVAGDES